MRFHTEQLRIQNMKYILLFLLFILFPICGIQSIKEGEIGSGIFFLFPLFALICGIAYNFCVIEPRKKRQEALQKMYNLPDVVRDEYGHKWDREFQQVISKAIEEATDNEKRNDLLQCQKVAKGMIKDSKPGRFDRPYFSINQAFCLTGCHLTITDSQGKTITQIV